MANGDRLGDQHWRFELKDGSTLIGVFDFEEIKSGTDGGELSRDPEFGARLRAGLKTRDPFDVSHPWQQGRDGALADLLERDYWNKKVIDGHAWELDPATGDPYTSNPTISLKVMVRGVGRPKGSASSADESRLGVTLEPQP